MKLLEKSRDQLCSSSTLEGGEEEVAAVSYDSLGRMNYHPDFHHNHCTRFTESDLEYMCKFYEVDPIQILAMALGRTEKTIRNKIRMLRIKGQYDYYKNLNKHW